MWERAADAAGVPRFTLMGVLGGLAARGRHHGEAWGILGVEQPASTWEPADFYPDALAVPRAAAGARGSASRPWATRRRRPKRCSHRTSTCSGRPTPWGVAKPDPAFFARLVDCIGFPATRSRTSAIASTTTSSRRSRPGWRPSTCAAARGATCTSLRPRRSGSAPWRSSRRRSGCLSTGSAPASTPTSSPQGVPLVLGGVRVPFERGLAGHSDGDVLAHALTDAVLGAAGLEDIGALFPSGDPRWQGASSLDLLSRAWGSVRELGWELANADCVLIGEEPRLAPYRRRCVRRSRARSRSTRRSWPSGRRRPTASGSPGAAKGSPRRPWRCCGAALGRAAVGAVTTTSPSRSSDRSASSSSSASERGPSATRRSVCARRWRNDPSSGPAAEPARTARRVTGSRRRVGMRRTVGCGRGRRSRRGRTGPGAPRRRTSRRCGRGSAARSRRSAARPRRKPGCESRRRCNGRRRAAR